MSQAVISNNSSVSIAGFFYQTGLPGGATTIVVASTGLNEYWEIDYMASGVSLNIAFVNLVSGASMLDFPISSSYVDPFSGVTVTNGSSYSRLAEEGRKFTAVANSNYICYPTLLRVPPNTAIRISKGNTGTGATFNMTATRFFRSP